MPLFGSEALVFLFNDDWRAGVATLTTGDPNKETGWFFLAWKWFCLTFFLITQMVFWGCCKFLLSFVNPVQRRSRCDQSSSRFGVFVALAFAHDNKKTTWKQNYTCMICVFPFARRAWHCFTQNRTRTWSDAKQDNSRISMWKPEGFVLVWYFGYKIQVKEK